MSDPTVSQPQSLQISLRDMGLKYLGALQHVFDMASASLGALRTQTEKDYEEFSRAARFMPSQQQHLEFDRARPAVERWLLKQLLADALGLMIPFLEDTRSVASLARWKAEGGTDQSRLKEILETERNSFLKLPLEEKLKFIHEKFGVTTPNAPFIEGYLKLGQALVRGGKVAETDTTDGTSLVVRLAVVDLQTKPTGEGSQAVSGRLIETQKKFAVGETIDFRKEEILSLFASIAVFITGMMSSLQADVSKYVQNEEN